MGVTITQAPGTPLTWGQSSFAWSAPYAGKPYDGFSPSVFTIEVGEGFSMAEGVGIDTTKPQSEIFALADSAPVFQIGLVASEAVNFAETLSDAVNFLIGIHEYLSVAESEGKDITQEVFMEAISVAGGNCVSGLGQAFIEALSVGETGDHVINFVQTFAESLNFVEANAKEIGLSAEELMAFRDVLMRNANAVLADLAIRDTPMTDSEFAALIAEARHVGYSRFQTLVPGDYQYQKAIVALIVDNPLTSGRAALSKATLTVDAPDISDRGSVTLPAERTWVPFNRTFNCPAGEIEVACSFRSGVQNATPHIAPGDIHKDGFWVSLVSNADSYTVVPGVITWQAIGY